MTNERPRSRSAGAVSTKPGLTAISLTAVPKRLAPGSMKSNLIVEPKWLRLVEEWGKKQPGLMTRSDAIRKIVEEHCREDADSDKPKKKGGGK